MCTYLHMIMFSASLMYPKPIYHYCINSNEMRSALAFFKNIKIKQKIVNDVYMVTQLFPNFSYFFSTCSLKSKHIYTLASRHSRIFSSSNLVHMVHPQPPVSTPSSPSMCCGAESQSDASPQPSLCCRARLIGWLYSSAWQ